MPLALERFPVEPIILITASGVVTADDFAHVFAEIAAITDDTEGKLYRIADFTGAETSFMDVYEAIKRVDGPQAAFSAHWHEQTIYVGTTQWVGFARKMLHLQSGGILAPTFDSLDDALTYVRREIAKMKGVTGFLTNKDYFHRISAKDMTDGDDL